MTCSASATLSSKPLAQEIPLAREKRDAPQNQEVRVKTRRRQCLSFVGHSLRECHSARGASGLASKLRHYIAASHIDTIPRLPYRRASRGGSAQPLNARGD